MTVKNVSFSSISFNGIKSEAKPAEIPEEEAVQEAVKPSALQKLQEKRRNDLEYAKMELENQRENEKNGSTQGAMMRDYGKLLKIATRIMNGDYVPLSDKKKLAEAMPDLYKQAEMMKRTDNESPKKYKKEFEDEEEEGAQEMISENVENKAAEAISKQETSSLTSE